MTLKLFLSMYSSDQFFRLGVDAAIEGQAMKESKPWSWDESNYGVYQIGYKQGEKELYLHKGQED